MGKFRGRHRISGMGRDRERNEALRKLLTQLDEEYGPLPENDVERLMRDVYVSETSEPT